MKLLKNEKAEKSTYVLEFSVEKDVFDNAVEKVYRKQVKKINIPGFRPGKAPKVIIEKMYGESVFYEDAINDLIPENYSAALDEAGIKPVGQPKIDVVSVDENGLVLSAIVPVRPDCKVEDYKGIEVERDAVEVNDDEVAKEINTVRERNSREIEDCEEAAQNGDFAKIDFEGFVDGEAFEGGKGEDYSLKLGSGSFIPGFEEQVVGHKKGDSFDVNVSFPEDYHAKELAGKPAVFKVTVKSVTKVQLPELDDDFAKDVSEFDTLNEYRDDIRAKIQKRHETEADNRMEEELVNKLMDKLEAEIPEAMFEAETENFVRDYDNRLRMQGLDLSTYFKYTGLDLDKLREQFRPQAERQVKARLALETVAKVENIEVTDEELDAEYAVIANSYKMEKDKVKELVSSDMVKEDIKVKKAMQIIKDSAVVTQK